MAEEGGCELFRFNHVRPRGHDVERRWRKGVLDVSSRNVDWLDSVGWLKGAPVDSTRTVTHFGPGGRRGSEARHYVQRGTGGTTLISRTHDTSRSTCTRFSPRTRSEKSGTRSPWSESRSRGVAHIVRRGEGFYNPTCILFRL